MSSDRDARHVVADSDLAASDRETVCRVWACSRSVRGTCSMSGFDSSREQVPELVNYA